MINKNVYCIVLYYIVLNALIYITLYYIIDKITHTLLLELRMDFQISIVEIFHRIHHFVDASFVVRCSILRFRISPSQLLR